MQWFRRAIRLLSRLLAGRRADVCRQGKAVVSSTTKVLGVAGLGRRRKRRPPLLGMEAVGHSEVVVLAAGLEVVPAVDPEGLEADRAGSKGWETEHRGVVSHRPWQC